ncbi:hypothetical protein ACFOLD_03275 [Kocuria carniphila]|uniref:hypothetical protein n=1 Tax=Kocuria carniphila TaxID=262208 RepID=UPI00361E2D65
MRIPAKAEAIARATSLQWADWASLLTGAGGASLSHAQLAEVSLQNMPEAVTNPGWWASPERP